MGIETDLIWFDGKLVPWKEANVHVMTHTLHYGVGVFEGIRAYKTVQGGSAVFRLKEHVARLFGSATIVGTTIPFSPAAIAPAPPATSTPWAAARLGGPPANLAGLTRRGRVRGVRRLGRIAVLDPDAMEIVPGKPGRPPLPTSPDPADEPGD